MLIDKYLPIYQFSERHGILISGSPEAVYRSIRSANLADSWFVRTLFTLRLLPLIIIRPVAGIQRLKKRYSMSVRLSDFEEIGFSVLEENCPKELVIGLEGKFWTINGGMKSISSEAFLKPQSSSVARAIWNFRIEKEAEGKCRLITETRVACVGNETLKKFKLYWIIIRPWSGLIRRYMLKAIRKEAESTQKKE